VKWRVFCRECLQDVAYVAYTTPDDPDVIGLTVAHVNNRRLIDNRLMRHRTGDDADGPQCIGSGRPVK
jgi:hypothetical protein